MDGPGHYRAAERRLHASDWQRQQSDDPADLASAMHEAAAAQVHATLALAAATALAIDPTPEAVEGWDPLLLDEASGGVG